MLKTKTTRHKIYKPSKPKWILFISFLLWFTTVTYGQVNLAGVVTGEEGKPLAHVEISCAGLAGSVQTNASGEYTIQVPSTCKALHFELDGREHTEKIRGRRVINVQWPGDDPLPEGKTFRYNIMLNAGGAVVWGAVSGSIMVTDFMSIDAGLGLGKFYGGTTVYFNAPFKNKHWQPYTGLNVAYFEEFMGPVSTLIYVPAGLRYLNSHGTSVSFEAGFLQSNNDNFLLESPVWGGIRFGKYF